MIYQIVKIIGAALIIFASVMTACLLNQRERTAISALKEIASSYVCLASDIRIGLSSLPEAFCRISQKSHDELAKVFFDRMSDIMLKASGMRTGNEYVHDNDADMNEKDMFVCNSDISSYDFGVIVITCAKDVYEGVLSDSDIKLVCELGRLPVYLDADTQTAFLEELACNIRRRVTEMTAAAAISAKMHNAVCLCAGITLVIIVI